MRLFTLAAIALFALSAPLSAPVRAQSTGNTAPPQTTTAQPAPAANSAKSPKSSKTQLQEAPGGGPDKVWVNTNSSVYHCPGDRFYGKTAHGRYMTEAAAKSAGAKGVGGKTCFAGK